eukprot:TRINITY_DN14914_c0_g1_i1.p1 TRINITY_DN14914_c0_g1~~TRINITY_DN14914_c0_g1_i1.p1  ORF type:complete len:358 (+),score=45.05 TRINITY_DN14914_c0_g1_i1:74-1147(+)
MASRDAGAAGRLDDCRPKPPRPHRTKVIAVKMTKTRLCKHFDKGSCNYGDQCAYAHSTEELADRPDFERTKMCAWFPLGRCHKKVCRFAHYTEDIRGEWEENARSKAATAAAVPLLGGVPRTVPLTWGDQLGSALVQQQQKYDERGRAARRQLVLGRWSSLVARSEALRQKISVSLREDASASLDIPFPTALTYESQAAKTPMVATTARARLAKNGGRNGELTRMEEFPRYSSRYPQGLPSFNAPPRQPGTSSSSLSPSASSSDQSFGASAGAEWPFDHNFKSVENGSFPLHLEPMRVHVPTWAASYDPHPGKWWFHPADMYEGDDSPTSAGVSVQNYGGRSSGSGSGSHSHSGSSS